MGRTFGSRLADVPACVEHAGPAALRAVLVAACLVLALTGQAQAAPGDLDTSFSDDGKQTTGFGGLTYTSAMALGTDGKIVVAGSVDQGAATGYDFALARYNVDGTLDSSFAGDGKQTFDFGGDDGVSAVVVQDDGKILVAGRLSGFELARLNVDGTLDSSFSGDGMQTTGFGGAGGLAIQDDGKIVVAGSTDESGFFSADFAVARYNLDGTLDSSFAGDGMQTTDFPQSGAGASAVAIQDDGKIVLAGGSQQPGPEGGAMVLYESAAARYNADGTLDSSFAGDGTLTTNSSDEFNAVAVQDDGKILFADGGGVARYNTDGTLDTSFAGLGGGLIRGVALQSDQQIVSVGMAIDAANSSFNVGVARHNADGTPDTSFSGDGYQDTDFGGGNEIGEAVAIQDDGKIVVAGFTFGSGFALARYVVDSAPTAAPTLTETDPDSRANNNAPNVKGTAAAGSTVRLYIDALCSGAIAATGPAADFASVGLTVTVIDDSSTTFHATATDQAGNTSACSSSSITYIEDSTAPIEPIISGLDSGTSADNNTPKIKGTAAAGSTVRLYSDASCSGAIAATGPAADFASVGLTVTVTNDSSTTFHATATDQAGNTSACSSSSITYIEDSTQPSPPPPPPPPPPAPFRAAVVDRTPPTATLTGSKLQKLGKTVRVSVSCPHEACMATVSGTVRVPRIGAAKSRRYKLTKVSGTITKGGRITFKPKLSSAARNAIKQALRRGRRITVDLKVIVADRTGNTTTLARKIRLRL